MGLELWMIGRSREKYLLEGIQEYEKRLSNLLKISSTVLPLVKHAAKLSALEVKRQEGEIILQKIQAGDFLILLDERGKLMDSRQFSRLLENRLQQSAQRTIFLIGGAYGFDEAVYNRSDLQLSLSKMTFSHQLIRLIFWEQLYRGASIMKGLPYHND